MALDIETLEQEVQSIPSSISKDIERNITTLFDKCGLYYRIFSRCKSGQSALEKIQQKRYDETGKKMQDLIGNSFLSVHAVAGACAAMPPAA